MLEVADLPALVAAAHARGVLVVVGQHVRDPAACCARSTTASDVVVHSVTKYLAGHSDVVLGRRRDPPTRTCSPGSRTDRTCAARSPGPFEA